VRWNNTRGASGKSSGGASVPSHPHLPRVVREVVDELVRQLVDELVPVSLAVVHPV